MKNFKLSFLSLVILLFINACSSTPNTDEPTLAVCPQCNMELPKSNAHTVIIEQEDDKEYFDDPGCMVLWAQKNDLNLKETQVKIFSNDTKKYINAKVAFYKIDEKTPMLYGFSAYEKEVENSIDFDEVIVRMLRGEHLANPKIRKHILGY